MNQVWNIARKEFSDGLRNRWLLAISLLFAVLAVGIAWLGAAASGQLGFTSIPATIASLASLATFLMPLIALLLAYDAIVGEEESGTLMLLLTYPLGHGQILMGKFVGHGLILALATLLGFGCAAWPLPCWWRISPSPPWSGRSAVSWCHPPCWAGSSSPWPMY